MLCENCRKELQEGWIVCPNCGNEISCAESGNKITAAESEKEISAGESTDKIFALESRNEISATESEKDEGRQYTLVGVRRKSRFSFWEIKSEITVQGEHVHIVTEKKKREESSFTKGQVQSISFTMRPVFKAMDYITLVIAAAISFFLYGIPFICFLILDLKMALLHHVQIKLSTGQTVKIPICQKGDASEFLREFNYPEAELQKNDARQVSFKKWAFREWITTLVCTFIAVVLIGVAADIAKDQGMDENTAEIKENIIFSDIDLESLMGQPEDVLKDLGFLYDEDNMRYQILDSAVYADCVDGKVQMIGNNVSGENAPGFHKVKNGMGIEEADRYLRDRYIREGEQENKIGYLDKETGVYIVLTVDDGKIIEISAVQFTDEEIQEYAGDVSADNTEKPAETDTSSMMAYLTNDSELLPIKIENIHRNEWGLGFDIVNVNGVDIETATFGIVAWDFNKLPMKISGEYFARYEHSNIAAGQTSQVENFIFMEFSVGDCGYMQMLLLECTDFEGNTWTNPAASYYEEKFAGKKFDGNTMTACAFDVGDTENQEETDQSETEQNPSAEESTGSEFVFPDSDKRYLTEEEVRSVDVELLSVGRNEIFARHGYIFKTENLQEYFESTSWYEGTVPGDQFNSEKEFNNYEKKNVELIKKVENESDVELWEGDYYKTDFDSDRDAVAWIYYEGSDGVEMTVGTEPESNSMTLHGYRESDGTMVLTDEYESVTVTLTPDGERAFTLKSTELPEGMDAGLFEDLLNGRYEHGEVS